MTSQRLHHSRGSASFNARQPDVVRRNGLAAKPIKLVAAEAGFLPPAPFTFLADIVL